MAEGCPDISTLSISLPPSAQSDEAGGIAASSIAETVEKWKMSRTAPAELDPGPTGEEPDEPPDEWLLVGEMTDPLEDEGCVLEEDEAGDGNQEDLTLEYDLDEWDDLGD